MIAAASDRSPIQGLLVVVAAGVASSMLASAFLAYLGLVASTPMGIPLVGTLTLTKVTGVLGVVSYAVNLILRRVGGFSLRVSPVIPLTLAFLGWSIVSIGYAQDQKLAWNEFRASLHGYAAFFLTIALVRDRSRLRVVAWTLALVGISQALVGLAEYALGFKLPGAFIETSYSTALEPRADLDEVRPAGTTGHPLFLAPLLQMSIGITLWLGCEQAARWKRGLLWLTIPLMVLVWVLAESRMSLIAVVLVGGIYGWRHLRRRSLWLLAGTAVLLVAILVGGNVSSRSLGGLTRNLRLSRVFSMYDSHSPVYLNLADPSVRLRASHIVAGWRMFLRYPWTGVGVGNWVTEHETYLPNWAYPKYATTAHNAFAQVGAELGVVGFLLSLGMLGASFADLRRVRHHTAGRTEQRSLHQFAEILEAVLILQLFSLMGFERGRVIFLLLAFAPTLVQILETERAQATASPRNMERGRHAAQG